jgi:hypothetical protein
MAFPLRIGSGRPSVPALPVAALAAAAVVLGHKVVYALAIPAVAERSELLSRTGHGYLPGATRLLVMAALTGLGSLFLRAVGRRDTGAPDRVSMFARLAILQVSIFAVMEIVERLAAGTPIAGIVDHGLFVLGIAAQLLLAFAGAALLRLIHRRAESVTAWGSPPVLRARAIAAIPSYVSAFGPFSDGDPAEPRGPPAP